MSVTYDLIQAEIDAGVTPANYSYPPYNLRRYGGVGDGVTINNTAIADWKKVCDQVDTEGLIPEGQFKISADVEFPKKVQCYGSITGNFNVIFQQRQGGWIYGLKCEKFKLRGCYFCNIQNLTCQSAFVDGFNNSFGVFWNEFIQWRVDKTLTIDITNWSVNLNTWRGGRIGYLHITGNQSTYAGTQAHANSFDGTDFTDYGNVPSGVLQDDTANEVNFMRGCYFEGGATIDGNFHIFGYQGDALGMPPIDRFAHIMGSVGRNARLCRDFLSLSPTNAARGGSWDILDSSGKPPSLSQSLGSSVAVAADANEPCGIGRRYEATFSAAFSRFTITLQPTGSNRFGLVLFYRSTADFAAVESNDGSGAISHGVLPVAVGSDWKMLRICGPASTTSTTSVSLFAYGGAGGSGKFFAIGGFFATGERAVISPQRPATVYRYGSATYDPPSLATDGKTTTTVSVAGVAPGTGFAQASFTSIQAGVYLSAEITAANTVTVEFWNRSGAVLNLPSGTLRVQVQEAFA